MKDWDIFFLRRARDFALEGSKDPSTKVGSLIVRPDNTIASEGWNGFPWCMPDRFDWLKNREEKYDRVIHAEMNALIFARERLQGYTLYSWPLPICHRCLVHTLQAGIVRYVWTEPTEDQKSRGWDGKKTKQYLKEVHDSNQVTFRVSWTEVASVKLGRPGESASAY